VTKSRSCDTEEEDVIMIIFILIKSQYNQESILPNLILVSS